MKETSRAVPNAQLRRERTERCLSQDELAQEIGTTSFNVSRWERGVTSPSFYYRQKLCLFFGKSAEALGLLPRDGDSHEHVPVLPVPGAVVCDPAVPPSQTAHGLVGRDEFLVRLKQRLRAGGANLALSALNGLPGVGKTTLAIALAHDSEIQAYFSDGILWAGLGRTPNLPGLLSRWGTLLNLAPTEMAGLSDSGEWSKAIHAAIGRRRMLIVIDDAWKVEHALTLKVGGPYCAHLVTTRIPEIALQFAGTGAMAVQELSEDDGVALLKLLAPDIAGSEAGEIRSLVRSVGGLPLALTLIGNHLRLQAHSGQPRRLRMALDRLRDAGERLRLAQPQSPVEASPSLEQGVPLSLEAIIDVSNQELDHQAAYALHALGVFPPKPNTFSEEAAQAVCALPVEFLDALTDAGLLEGSGPNRYCLHQTISDYARFHLSDPAVEERMAAFFVSYIETYRADYHALERETANILAALRAAFEQDMQASLVRGIIAFAPFLEARGLHSDAQRHLKRAQQAAISLHDEKGVAYTWLHLGRIEDRLGNPERADQLYCKGLDLARGLDDRELVSAIQTCRGEAALNRDECALAREYLLEGLELARALGDRQRICVLLKDLGEMTDHYGDHARGQDFYQEGLNLALEIENWETASALLQNLGVKADWRGEYALAETYYKEGLLYAYKIGHLQRISALLMNMGVLAFKQGQFQEAEALYLESLDIARTTGHRLRMGSVLQNLGTLEGARENYAQADRSMQESLKIAREIGQRWLAGETLCEWGEIHLKRGMLAEAFTAFDEAQALAQEVKSPHLVALALFGLARVSAARGDPFEARELGRECYALFRSFGFEKTAQVGLWLDSLPGA